MSEQNFAATPRTATIRYGKAAPEPPQQTPATPSVATSAAAVDWRTFSPGDQEPQSSPTALLVCHGMGEQVRFQTIGQIAASLLNAAKGCGCDMANTTVHLSEQKDSLLARAELTWKTPEGKGHCVHIYEAYWAPVTEGKVTYIDTLLFLFSAAFTGIRKSRTFGTCFFQRYLFGDLRSLPIFAGTQVVLMVVLALVAAQAGAIALVLAKLADQVKQIEAAHLALKQIALILAPGWHTLADPNQPVHARVWAGLALLGWYLLVAEIFFVRYFLIEYVGDVAAYISPYKASKFDEIRTEIQSIGLGVAKVIYGFTGNAAIPAYEKVVIAGHSLGSVLAYDTLNAIINLDNTAPAGEERQVMKRTTNLITFGSPLDKTAFLFRNQANDIHDPVREQMAATFQPLILDYDAFRKPGFWINLYSPMDVISGSLDYYDHPDVAASDPLHVQNRRDPKANLPFYAHVQYWDNPLLATVLYDAVS